MKIRTTVVCLPVHSPERTLAFYRDALGFSDLQLDEGTIVLELPNLSLFLMAQDAFEVYSIKAGRKAMLPEGKAPMVISCAMESKEEVDDLLEKAERHGGTTGGKAAIDETSGGYTGYLADPDGHLWELVFPAQGAEVE